MASFFLVKLYLNVSESVYNLTHLTGDHQHASPPPDGGRAGAGAGPAATHKTNSLTTAWSVGHGVTSYRGRLSTS